MKKLIFSTLTLLLLNGCQTLFPIMGENGDVERTISHEVCPDNIEHIELADIDYLLYANKMIDSMVKSDFVQKETAKSRIRLFISPLIQTNNAIDIKTLNTSIKNRTRRSGLFIIVNDRSAADYYLSGAFAEIAQQTSVCVKVYDEFLLQLKNNRTDAVLWSDKKQFK